MIAPHEEALARSAIYELLSLALLYPEENVVALLSDAARRLGPMASEMGHPEIGRALGMLSMGLASMEEEDLEGEYIGVFGHALD